MRGEHRGMVAAMWWGSRTVMSMLVGRMGQCGCTGACGVAGRWWRGEKGGWNQLGGSGTATAQEGHEGRGRALMHVSGDWTVKVSSGLGHRAEA